MARGGSGSTHEQSEASRPPSERIRRRIGGYPWRELGRELDQRGYARLPGLLSPEECREIAALYPQSARFRSTVDMARYRFGEGEYRYFAHPLPPLVRALRTHLYPRLRVVANHWEEQLGSPRRYPARLAPFLEECHAADQCRPTPLLLRYGRDGYNCLHQDLYGGVVFPLQVACLLSRPLVAGDVGRPDSDDEAAPGHAAGFRGGEFLLVEQRPRMQSRGEAIALELGEGVVFATRERPVAGARGHYRARVRHGVSRIRAGARCTLGIIFHDAR
jgi:hypothetical protein